jgi:hypothetical protein
MNKVLYIYQNYTNDYSSASLSILKALKKIKEINIKEFEMKPISYNNNVNRIVNRLPFLRSINIKKQNSRFQEILKKDNYDFLFVMKGTDIKTQTLKLIKDENPSLKLICFNPDDPFNEASSNSDIVSSIPLYDYYCIWTRHLDYQLREAGANEIIYLPFGVDNEIIYPVDAEFQYDISFIGNGDTERHQLVKALNDEIVKKNLKFKVHIFGNNWHITSKQVVFHGQRTGIELLKTISASKINLNLLRKQNKNSINMRTFEIPAANGFMLHEASEEAKMFFIDNEEVVFFTSVSDLVNKCDFYLSNEVMLNQVRKNGHENISINDYSYEHLIKNKLRFLSKVKED